LPHYFRYAQSRLYCPEQAVLALHSIAILQIFQADPRLFAKSTAKAIRWNMASLTIAEKHLWLTLSEMPDLERSAFLDAPISPAGLFGLSIKDFVDRFSEVQKTSYGEIHSKAL